MDPDPQISGVYKGTTWNINWGDGTADMNFTSTTNSDFPNNALRTHPYPAITNCVYTVTLNIQSPAPCSKFFTVKYQVFVHGRDVPTDGDGVLRIQENITGLITTIPVCEGSTHTVTLRDMSTWNCQNPVLGGLPWPLARNTSDRTIQWLYGIDNGGVLQNTIGQTLGLTPNVVIGGANNAIRTIQGYTQPIIAPAAYQGELSQTILIPATCRAGEIFNVYLRNWNKCNVYGIDPPVFTQIQILVVAAPGLPVASNKIICSGGDPTLSAAHGVPAGGVLNWYATADKSTPILASGLTFNPGVSAVGTYTYYVADGQTTGNLCEGPTTPVVLTIREPLTITDVITGVSPVCLNATGLGYSLPNPPASQPFGGTTEYRWTIPGGWSNLAGDATRQITADATGTTGAKTMSVIWRYTTAPNCPSAAVTMPVTVNAQPVGPTLLLKTPNLAAVCVGTLVSATFNAGSGGVGCADAFQYRFDGAGGWSAYTPGNTLNTTGHTSVDIQGRRTGCTASAGCTGTAWVTLASWTVNAQPIGPTLNVKTPNLATVCAGTLVSATFNAGSGGVGCADAYQYRFDGAGGWSAYTPGNTLNTTGHTSVDIQGQRAGCTATAGCTGTAWVTLASWAVNAQPVGPTLLAKTPNLAAVCVGTLVSATFNGGSGGVGCADAYQYRFDGAGGWSAYTPGNTLNTTGHTSVDIQGQRAGCTALAGCTGTAWVTLASWTVNAQPVGPTLNVKTPNLPTVCNGTLVSATFTAGSGGVGCADAYQYRFDGAGGWSAYTPGNTLNTTGHTSVDIQGQRAGCTATAGCTGTAWATLATWTVNAQPVGPTLNVKTPNLAAVCVGTLVSATFTAGSGGVGCADAYQYRFDGVGGWSAYTPGNTLNTTGHTSVDIQGQRAGCTAASGCTGTAWVTLASWTVNAQPVGPTLNVKTPNLATVCNGTLVSATFTAGSGGVGCADAYQYRFDGAGGWSAYTPGNTLNTTGHTSVDIQGQRTGCTAGAGCTGTAWVTLASWTVNAQPVGPTLNVKTPNLATVCAGTLVSATFNAGSGGVGCADAYQYRFDGAGGWLAYTPGNTLNTTGHTSVDIQGQRAGCTALSGCTGTAWVTLASWAVNIQPVGPTLLAKTPNLATVCAGTLVSATFTAGSGGVGCADAYQYRFDAAGGWSAYVPGNTLNTTGHTSVDIQGQRAGCTAGAGCTGTAWVTLASWTVNAQPVGPTLLAKTPNTAGVCSGTLVNATFNAGTGGVGCSDAFQYRFDGAGVWTVYTGGTNLNTTGHTLVEIQGQRTGCTAGAGCTGTAWVTLATWIVNPLPTPSISGSVSVCANDIGIIYSTGNTGNSFLWAISGGVISGGQGTYTITVNWGAAGAGWVNVTETILATGCSTATANYNVTKNPGTPVAVPTVTGPANVCLGASGLAFSTTAVAGAADYEWDTPSGSIITAGTALTYDASALALGSYNFRARGRNGCGNGPYSAIITLNIVAQPTGPTLLLKTPNLATVCDGQTVNATFTAGSGGVGCTDGFQYRFDGAGVWTAYTGGTNLNTAGHTLVEIQGQRTGCTAGSGCTGTAWVTLATWNVNPQPTGPTLLLKTPNLVTVCDGQLVRATFNAGSGGVGCTDGFQYRFDGAGVWTAYTPNTDLNTTGHTLVEIQGQRTGCTVGSGCTGTAWVTLVTWNVNPQPTGPTLLLKTPNLVTVCAGQLVRATFTAGTGGVGCSDAYQYRFDGVGLWTAYTPNTDLNTTAHTLVEIQGQRTGCTVGSGCTGTAWVTLVTWNVNPQPTGPTLLLKTPNLVTVCSGQLVNATFTAGSGGVGCTDAYQYRFDAAGVWTAYTPGTDLNTTGHTSVDIQGQRTGCTAGSGCTGTAWVTLATWNINPQPTGPTLLLKTPNLVTVCDGQTVNATFTAGSGGVGCTDGYQYRFDGVGVWNVYTGGTNLNTAGHTLVEIQGQRTGCTAGTGCTGTAWVTLATWNVNPQPTGPTLLLKTPNLATVCAGQLVNATFTAGSGGVGCTDGYQYRFDGVGVWTAYIPGTDLNTTGHTSVDIQGQRTGCTAGSGCTGTAWVTLATWNVNPQPTGPTLLLKTPNLVTVCDGQLVRATFNAGSGGVGCTDGFQYRFDGAGVWTAYTPNTDLNTTGHTLVEIQGQRTGCTVGSGCTGTAWVTLVTWNVNPQPTGPTLLLKTPNLVTVCAGQLVRATFTAGTGGVGCSDAYQYRFDGVGLWTAYTPNTDLNTTAHTLVEIQGQRTGCTVGSGCTGTAWVTLVTWNVNPQPTGPTLLLKTPNLVTVCSGQLVNATFTAGSGGVGCTDAYQYRFDAAGVWTAYTPGTDLNTTGHTSVDIQGQRTGCTAGSGCTGTAWVTLATWNINPQPTGPTLLLKTPNLVTVCDGQTVNATFTAGSGGVGCTDGYQYRFDGVGVWNVYTGGTNLNTAGHTLVEIQGQRTGCTAGTGCTGTAWVTLATWNVNPQPTGPTLLLKTPNLATVCAGQLVNATFTAGSGGVGCTDGYQYRFDGVGVWTAYIPGTDLNTTGHTSVDIQGQRTGCTAGSGCTGTAWVTLATWNVNPQPTGPTLLLKTPNLVTVCDGQLVRATFNAGSGGVGCTDGFQYRFDGAGVWTAYTPNTDLNTTGHTLVEIQGQRTGCTVGSGCTGTAWVTLVTWNVNPQPTGPTLLLKTPNLVTVCAGQLVRATFTAGTGGVGCSDAYQYRFDGVGLWTAYTPNTDLNTTAHTLVEIQGQRTGCTVGSGCTGTAWVTLVTWNVNPQPVGPTLNVKTPNQASVCEGQLVNATFNAGSGGVGCTDGFQYRFDGAGVWTVYTPGTDLNTTGHTSVDIQGQRIGCTAGSGCTGTAWVTLATWVVNQQPIGPTLNFKLPNLVTVCDGQVVSATFNAGSGGVGCTDAFQYRYDGAGVWVAYTPGNNISTVGHTLVEIQGQRAGCTAGCSGTPWVTLVTWNVNPQPVGPTLNLKTPATASVCVNLLVNATFNAGSGGVGCADAYQYRFDGGGVWTSYTPGTDLNTTGHNLVEIQGQRTGCTAGSGCTGTAWVTLASWIVNPRPVIFPAQSKTVCSRVPIGKEILLAPPNTPAGTLFSWPIPSISDLSVQGTAGVNVPADPAGTLQITDQIHNYSAAPIQATYNITPISQFGCAGTTVPVIITINPEPIPQPISGRDKICVTDKNIVYNVSAVGGSTFHWTVDATVGTKTFDFNTNAILIDAAAAAGSGNIIVTETNSFGCAGDASAMSVQVYAQPAAEVIAGNSVVCANSTNIYSVTARAGSIYNWTVPGGAAIMGDPSAASITVIFANVGGTILVRETNAAGCVTNHQAKNVTVNPLPTATISGGATICNGASRNLTVNFTGTGPYTFTYALNGVPQAPVATAANPYTLTVNQAGTYTIVNVSDANCTNNGTGTTTVSFFPQPTGTISGTAEMCRGGSATLTLSFTGTAPYTFTYTDGTTPVTVVGNLTNVYTVSVSPLLNTTYTLTSLTDGNTCTGVVSGSAVISVNIPPTLTLTGTNLICYNVNTGAVNMAIAGGTAPFGFSWTGPSSYTANTQNITLLASGYYAVVVTDSKGCTGTANITLTQPPVLSGSAAGTNITCFGAADGTITISGIGGGAGTYEFTINGGAPWQASPNFTALSPGTYNVMMRDALNPTCIEVLNNSLLLTQPTAITAVAAVTSNFNGSQISCNGATDGTLTVTASGGAGALSYLLNEQPGNLTGSINGIFTGLGAGSYTVRVRDLNLCTVNTAAVIITAPAAVTATALVTSNYNGSQISCIGASDGIITVTAGGGTGALTYILIQIPGNATGSASGIFTGVPAGTYTVRVTDLNGCNITTAPVTITNPAALTAAGSVTSNYNGSQVSCNGASDGVITVIAGGGTGVKTFVLVQNPANVTGAASGIFTGLNAATYTVTVTDINGCTKTTNNIVVSNPASITATSAITSNYNGSAISCNGALDGRITVTASGGTGTLSYLLIEQPLNVTGAATGIFTGLAAGSYTVRVTDINLCNMTTAPVLLTQPAAVTASTAITSNYNGSAISCNGATDGRITVTASGGTGALSYLLNEQPLNITGSISGIFTGLGAGSYTVRVRDLNLCTVNTVAVVITAPAAVTASALVTSNYNGSQVSCNGASDGRITVTAGGGTGALTYIIIQIPGNVTGSASGIFTGVPAGTYTVRVTDLNGCNITTLPVTISNPVVITAPISITSNYNGARITCFGASDGIITIVGAGGTGALSYVLDQDPANVSGAVTGIFTGLPAGTYTVTVKDVNLCSKTTTSVTLNNPPSISALAAVTSNYNGSQVSCNGSLDGRITVMASGGTGALSYLLVEMPLNVTGAATGIFTGVGAGTYTVRVSDLNSCNVITAPVTISNPAVIVATALVTSNYNGRDVSCNGASDGRITVTASGGSGALTYVLNEIPLNVTGLNTGIFTGVPAGASYTIEVTDKNGCNINTAPVAIVNPPVITATAAVTSNYNGSQVRCNGSSDGEITVTAGGGTGALNYGIVQLPGNLTGAATGVFTGIAAGTYTIKVTDVNGCNITTAPVTITNPASLTAAGSVTSNYNGSQVSCNGSSNGVITVIAGGGTGVRTLVLDQNPGNVTGAASGIFTGLNAGSYTITVTDINGCTKTTSNIIVSNPPAITATSAVTSNYNGSPISCNGALDGRIAVTASGGTGALSYLLIEQPANVTGAATGIFTGLAAGSYTVRVTDINLCNMTTAAVILTQPAAIVASATVTSNYNGSQLSCNGSTDGRITVTASGGTGALSYLLNEQPLNITGAVSGVFTGLGAGSFTVRVRDLNLCTINTVAVVITAPAVLGITVNKLSNFNGRDISCFGASDGRVEAVVTGGTGSYSYNWYSDPAMTISIGQLTSVALNLSAGTYYVRVRDLNNCTITGSITLNQPVALDASITTQANVTCYGGNTGSVTVVANPATGTAPYEYSINGGGSWFGSGTFSNLNASIYNVIAKDANGCQKQVPVTISQPSQLNGTVSKTDVSCFGYNDGTITITSPSGGSGNYQYSVDGGAHYVAGGNFANLLPGTYDVRISDLNDPSCTAILNPNLIITEPVMLGLTSTGDINLGCFGNGDGAGTFFASGGTLPYNFHVILPNTTGATLAAPGFNSQSFYNAGAGSIIIAVTDFHGCFAQATINVTQPAQLTPGTIAANQIVCAGTNPAQINETVPASGGPGAYNYQWQYGTTAAGPFFNIAGANGTLYTPPAGANTTLYYRRMITSGLCTPVYSNVIQVLVNPKPVAVLTGGETICPSQNSILKVNMMVGTGPFELDVANFGTITGYVSGSDIIVSPGITTVYTLTRVRDANGCEVIAPSANLIGSATVTVRDLPAITTSPVSKTICEFGMVAFNTIATGTDLTYQWYVNTGSGFNAVADGGVYFGATNSTLSLFGATRLMTGYIYHAVVTGCSASVTSADATLTVNTVPEISKQPRDSTVCLNAGATFRVTATGTAIAYQWQVNKGTGFNNVIDDANFSGSNLATLTMVNAQAVFNNYIFRVIVSGTCGIPVYSNFAVLRVNVPPAVTLNPANKSICDGSGPVIFSANGSGMIDSMRWEVFNGTAWSDVHDNAVYSGSTSQQLTLDQVPLALNGYLYRLALKAKCTTVNTLSGVLTVNPNPVVNFSAIDPIHACGSIPIVINGNPTGGSGIWSSHLWTGDIGPLNNYFVQSPTFTSQIAGTYLLNYKVKDSKGCSGNGNVTVLVDAPDATFNQDMSNGCTPLTVTFTKDMTGIASFSWDFGDGSPVNTTIANPVHIFTNANPTSIEYYDVKLTVTSAGGCIDTYTSSVTVYPSINATFTAAPATVCSGNQVIFTTLPGASKYFWDFGDGVSGYFTNTTNHLYTNFTTAAVVRTVTLTTTSFYNCTDVKTLNITVMPVPIPQFTAVPPTQEYDAAGNPVTFTNTTNAGTWNWLWHFGDGTTSTAQSPSHTYTNLGTYNVVLTVSNANCSDSVKHQVIVTPKKPIASFDLVPSGCSPLTITPNNTSQFTNTPGTSYMWDFGDGGASTSKNPTYTYFTAGTYVVKLTVSGPGGISTFIQTQLVNAYPAPLANFQISPTTVFVNDEKVRMFNLSLGADSYLWEFGDGDTSKVKEPFHKYLEEGVYDVTLWAYLHNVVNGVTITCSNKFVMSPGVTVEPSGILRFSTVFMPNTSSEVDMDHLPTGGTEIDQFFFPAIREKVIKYKLQIFNRLGVLIFESDDINKPWNGYYQHKLCPQGVYVWYVEGKYANGMPFKKVGDVTLLH